ncbi:MULTISPECIES: MmgE/PrpD family protein [unclassified Microbacterium]|uniref:MmgE/PrpD family protein n=1 Tax=unclassified Microbacterium TaxID=2609290 RepID=UPI00214B99B8|nr:MULTISPECIES: MmgE/PrpD family protein [unclassified Microbacterium]MCR2811392.1 MmgE/PrpD family protein [Microbacterium sp. zg.B185]WIM19562.1 MmgE/PrpD family protein [Microbacterium sp. zg-B185]
MAETSVESKKLVDFVEESDFTSLPAEVRAHVVRSFVDSVGCIVGGGRHPAVTKTAETLSMAFGQARASFLGQAGQADVFHASLINGFAGASYSYFDSYSTAHLHAGVVHAAALLAIAETMPVTGLELLSAYAAGMEVGCRITKSIALPPADADIGWSTGGIVSGVSAALASGRMHKLNSEQLMHAAGLATSTAAGTREQLGTMAGSLIFGQSAQNGVRAAILATSGFTSSVSSLDGQYGFLPMFSKVPNVPALTDGLGEQWELLSTTFKPFPTDIAVHPCVDGMLKLRLKHGFESEEIVRIDLQISDLAMTFCDRPTPETELDAKFSQQHWVASAARFGAAGLQQGTHAAIFDPEVRRLGAATNLTMDSNLGFDAGIVTIELTDGKQLSAHVEHCVGSAASPMSDADVNVKFVAQTSLSIGTERAEALAGMCWDAESLTDAAAIARAARKL